MVIPTGVEPVFPG